MAEYGVNIKASVQGQENVKKLAGEIKKITEGLEAADRAFSSFQSKLKSFDQRKREKEINEELDRRADIYTSIERMQRQLLANDNSRIRSLRKQADLEEHISRTISAGRMRRQSRALRLQGDPNAHTSPIGPQRSLERESRLQLMRQTASQVKAFDAQKKFAVEMGRINERLDRKTHDMKLNMLLQEFKTEEAFQKATFEKMMALSKKELDDNAKKLGIKTNAEIQAIKKVDNERRRVAREKLTLTGQTSPVGGTANMPGSPAALAAADRAKRIRSAQSSALIGGAFPLLFGQGAGASMGGAAGGFGGGMIGGEFGFGLSLVGTQLGSAVDQVVTSITNLSSSLQKPIEALNALEAAGIKVDSAFRLQIEQLESAGRSYEAQALLLDTLAQKLGVDAVAQLQALDDAQEETQQHISDLKSNLIVSLLPALTAASQGVNILAGVLNSLGNIKIPGPGGKEQTLDIPSAVSQTALGMMLPGGPFMAQIANKALSFAPKPELQAPELTPQQKVAEKELKSRNKIKALENDIGRLITENLQRNNNLLDKTVVANKQLIIDKRQLISDEEINLAVITKQLDHTSEGLKRDGERIKFRNEELTLSNQINTAVEANNKKLANANKKQEREDERQEKAIERRVKAVDREIERTENAFNKASQQLDSITQKHEDKMAFEREYSRLIMEGSTPAAAKQAVELKKQLLELDRGYEKLLQTVEAQIVKAEASLQDLKNQQGVTNEYIEQQKALDKLKKDRDGLEGNKGKAAGAIEKDLAPKTFLDKLDDEAERLQGVLNALVDPANQVIAAANAIGDAFSESFRGVISGSMTAQEALANLFQRTADHFLDMTAQIIAAAIKAQAIQFVTQIISSMAGAAATTPTTPTTPPPTIPGGATQTGLGLHINGVDQGINPFGGSGTIAAAEGAFVSGPTRALVGEGGEPEYIIPESKMRESMSRYSNGSRGNSVIPANGGGPGMGDSGGGVAVAAPIDVRYTVERINSVDYITADQFQTGMRSAAEQGAKRGEQNTLKRLQMSGSTRKRLGL